MAAPLDGHPHSPALPHSTSATPGRPLLAQQLPAMPTRSLSPTPALLVPLAALARQLLALHLAPLLAAWTLLAWAQAAVSAVRWRLRVERRHCPALVIAYRRCVVRGGPGHGLPGDRTRALAEPANRRTAAAASARFASDTRSLARAATIRTCRRPGPAWRRRRRPPPPSEPCVPLDASPCARLALPAIRHWPRRTLPPCRWRGLPRATLLFDDQINFPADRCRSALGFVLPAGGADGEGAARARGGTGGARIERCCAVAAA